MPPIYEYHCNKCNADFEMLTSFEDQVYECINCKELADKVVSAPKGYVVGSSNRVRQ